MTYPQNCATSYKLGIDKRSSKEHDVSMEMQRIKTKAIELGAKDADWRKWKFRCRIPADWREKIFISSSGSISFTDMDKVQIDWVKEKEK